MENAKYMKIAIKLAKKGGKNVRSNPLVGCVIVKNDKIIGQGYHKKYGQNHAEVEAINDAIKNGFSLENSDLYATLEPCCHFGKTPPCANTIIKNKVKRVFYGTQDLNNIVNGNGLKALQDAGIETIKSSLEQECIKLNKIFFVNKTKNRPFVSAKIATTINGKIADRNGSSKWISCDKSREYLHRNMRNDADAIITTSKTVTVDNANMNIRIGKKTQELNCIVVDKNLDILKNPELNIFKRKATTLFILCKKIQPCNINNVQLIECKTDENDHLIIESALHFLYNNHNICKILVEAGGGFCAGLLQQNLVDEICHFIAPNIIYDNKSISCFTDDCVNLINDKTLFKINKFEQIDKDLLVIYSKI